MVKNKDSVKIAKLVKILSGDKKNDGRKACFDSGRRNITLARDL